MSETTIHLNNVDVLSVEPVHVPESVTPDYVRVTVWNGDTYSFTLHDFDAELLASGLRAATDRPTTDEGQG